MTDLQSLQEQIKLLQQQKDNAYNERDRCVALISHMAIALGLPVGLGFHEGPDWEDDWRTIVFVDLPSGQISWHVHEAERYLFSQLCAYHSKWDGHSTQEKYSRTLCPMLEHRTRPRRWLSDILLADFRWYRVLRGGTWYLVSDKQRGTMHWTTCPTSYSYIMAYEAHD